MKIKVYQVKGGLRLKKAVKKCPKLQQLLIQIHPPKLDFKDRKALIAYNQCILRILYGLDVFFEEKMALVPTPLLRYNWLKRVIAKKSRVLEIGTGPTAMMVLLASRVFRCQCLATEINSDYLDLARKNVEKNDLEAQIHLLHSKGEILWGLIPPEMKFNHIISNPPYYPPGSYPEKSPWIGTPGEIQGRGDFGEKFILQLIEEGSDYLEKGGTLSFLVPENLKPLREKINNYLSENQVKYNVFGLKAGTRVRMVYTISQVDSSH